MPGLTVVLTGQQVQTELGMIAREVHQAMRRVEGGQDFLQSMNDQELLAPPFSLSQADINALRAAFTDLDKLRQIYRGQAEQTPTYNFRQNVRKIFGLGFQ